jgi:hypothetical protein
MTAHGHGLKIFQEVRTLERVKSELNATYFLIHESKHERLKTLINEAINEAALLVIQEDDNIDERI